MSPEKLVRDRIPEILANAGRMASVRRSDPSGRRHLLLAKLQEEASEVHDNLCLEELADVLEVLHALAGELNHPWEDVEKERARKREERGAFHKGWVLTLPED